MVSLLQVAALCSRALMSRRTFPGQGKSIRISMAAGLMLRISLLLTADIFLR